ASCLSACFHGIDAGALPGADDGGDVSLADVVTRADLSGLSQLEFCCAARSQYERLGLLGQFAPRLDHRQQRGVVVGVADEHAAHEPLTLAVEHHLLVDARNQVLVNDRLAPGFIREGVTETGYVDT